MKQNPWIQAARLRTLPLAFSCIITGAAIALQNGQFNSITLLLALLTTLFLQILSNYANDYGDAVSGKDKNRIGEKRMVASGIISPKKMKKAVIIVAFLSLISGLLLIIYSIKNYQISIVFVLIGLSSIWAAIKYTAGKNPYGYSGYGDIFVFIFFGLVGVLGSTFLFTQTIQVSSLLPAISIGALSTAVLTLNNLRDIENDAKTNKNTSIVKMGFANGKAYFAILIITAIICMLSYAIVTGFENRQYLFLLSVVIFSGIVKQVLGIFNSKEMDPFLKKTALETFLMSILFFIAMLY